MIKAIFNILAISISSIAFSQNQGNYILIIDNDSIQLDLDENISYQTKSGDNLSLKVSQPEIQTYKDEMISFKHHNSLKVNNAKIEEGIEQCMVMNSSGNGVMVQKYNTFNPTSLKRLMLDEIVKESVSYGYSKTEKEFSLKLKSGQTLEGIEATLEYRGETETYIVASYGRKDEGILVITMLMGVETLEEDEEEIVELFLETLEIID